MQWGTRNALNHGLRYLVPLLLCFALIWLAFHETGKQSDTESGNPATASIEVPFTRLAVENRLALAGVTWEDEMLTLSQGEYGGKLKVMERQGEISYIAFEMELLADATPFQGQEEYVSLLSQQKQDMNTAHTVYTAVMNALTPATGITQKQQEQGAEKLNNCLKAEKSYAYDLKGWSFSFYSEDGDLLRTVTFALYRMPEE